MTRQHDPRRAALRIRTFTAILLGLALPAGLVAALYLGDWRHALAGLIVGLTGLIVGTAPAPKQRTLPCGARSIAFLGDPPTRHRCDRERGHNGPHGSAGIEWGKIAAPWPAREDLPEEGRT